MSTSSGQDESGNAVVVNQTAPSTSGQNQVDLADLDDPKRAELIQQVRNLIEARPDDAVAVVRQWMKQGDESVGA
jgi:flagellar biosynthesis/type III secretory pathway M-ring protein FliF/YscJ